MSPLSRDLREPHARELRHHVAPTTAAIIAGVAVGQAVRELLEQRLERRRIIGLVDADGAARDPAFDLLDPPFRLRLGWLLRRFVDPLSVLSVADVPVRLYSGTTTRKARELRAG